MLEADHIYAVRRSFESRAMPETEKLLAKPVDIYYELNLKLIHVMAVIMYNKVTGMRDFHGV